MREKEVIREETGMQGRVGVWAYGRMGVWAFILVLVLDLLGSPRPWNVPFEDDDEDKDEWPARRLVF